MSLKLSPTSPFVSKVCSAWLPSSAGRDACPRLEGLTTTTSSTTYHAAMLHHLLCPEAPRGKLLRVTILYEEIDGMRWEVPKSSRMLSK